MTFIAPSDSAMISIEIKRAVLKSMTSWCSTSLKIYSGLNIDSPAITSDICEDHLGAKMIFVPGDSVAIRFRTGIKSQADFQLVLTSFGCHKKVF